MQTPPTPEEMRAIMTDADKLRQFFAAMPEAFWVAAGKKYAYETFRAASEKVPAYRNFLQKADISPDDITPETFAKLPAVTKDNYFDAYPLPELVIGGELSNAYWVPTSSGTTGKPHYWPRLAVQDMFNETTSKLMLSFFEIGKKSTLYIVGVSLGTWIGGIYATDSILKIASHPENKITALMPGTDNAKIIEIIRDLGQYYDQTIVLGYPPTIRNFLLEGIEQGMDWQRYHLKLMIGGEPVSTKWKDYMLELIGSKNMQDIQVNFAMAEVGVVSFETPIAALIRKITHADKALGKKLFGKGAIAALTQYLPNNRYIETDGEELLITTAGGAPLVRYNTHDFGGVIPYGEMLEHLKAAGHDVLKMLAHAGYPTEEVWQWPFFYSKGRSDSVSLVGANIYPENLEDFMHKHHQVNDFKIGVVQTESQRPQFKVYLELRETITLDEEETAALCTKAQVTIHELLMENNEDYAQSYEEDPEVLAPSVEVLAHRSGVFADIGQKQRHVLTYTE